MLSVPGRYAGRYAELTPSKVGQSAYRACSTYVDPLVAAERAAGQLELEDVVEDTPAAVQLRLAVALEVVGEAEARCELVSEAELDAEVRDVGAWV